MNNRVLSFLFVIVIFAMSVLMFSACSNNDADKESTTESTTAGAIGDIIENETTKANVSVPTDVNSEGEIINKKTTAKQGENANTDASQSSQTKTTKAGQSTTKSDVIIEETDPNQKDVTEVDNAVISIEDLL